MICDDCRESLYPEDPTQPFFAGVGRYLKPLCYGCPSYEIKETEAPEPEWIPRQWNTITQLRGMMTHIQGKLNKHIDTKKGELYE